jgi:hypothetical protein
MIETWRGYANQGGRQLVGSFMRQSTEHDMAESIGLLFDCRNESGMPISMDHAPPGASGIKKLLAIFQGKVRSSTTYYL